MFYVTYSIAGFDKEYCAGPYDTLKEAFDHQSDIAGYEGVTHCLVVPSRVALKSEAEKVGESIMKAFK